MNRVVAPEAPWAEPVAEAPYPMSRDAFARWPREDVPVELVRGRLVRSAPRTFLHLRLAARILQRLLAFDVHPPGFWAFAGTWTFSVRLSGEKHPTALVPDVALVQTTQLSPVDGTMPSRQFLEMVPDLVVEIASQGQDQEGLAAKAQVWLAAGTRLVWLIWPPTKQVIVWRASREAFRETLGLADTLDGRDILPGFSLPVAELFSG